jgi:hypothetical protein
MENDRRQAERDQNLKFIGTVGGAAAQAFSGSPKGANGANGKP